MYIYHIPDLAPDKTNLNKKKLKTTKTSTFLFIGEIWKWHFYHLKVKAISFVCHWNKRLLSWEKCVYSLGIIFSLRFAFYLLFVCLVPPKLALFHGIPSYSSTETVEKKKKAHLTEVPPQHITNCAAPKEQFKMKNNLFQHPFQNCTWTLARHKTELQRVH